MGYSPTQSAYYCFDPKTSRIYTSRHVHFVESKFPFIDLNKSQPPLSSPLEEWCPLSLPFITSATSQPPMHPPSPTAPPSNTHPLSPTTSISIDVTTFNESHSAA